MAELPLTMPKMSMTMEEGTMVSWLKNIGDSVRAGEPICEVATDKVDMEVESPFDGVLARITAEVDDVIKVGETIALITTDADDLLGGLFDEPTVPEAAAPELHAAPVTPARDEVTVPSDWPAAVPAARVLAGEHHLDLRTVTPTGPWGTILVADVEAAASRSSQSPVSVATLLKPVEPQPAPAVVEPVTHVVPPPPVPGTAQVAEAAPVDPATARRRRVRIQTAKVMTQSAAIPQFTAFVDIDLEALAAVRKTLLGGASWTALLVRAQALALRKHPELNASWTESGPVANPSIGIALAVDSPTGLLAPVMRDPDRMSLSELVDTIAKSISDARAGTITADMLSGGTSVFSNLGGYGVDSFNALLTPPQATALSAGAARKKVVALESGAIAARLRCTVGLTVDHRVADGGDAAKYLATLVQIMSSPDELNRASRDGNEGAS